MSFCGGEGAVRICRITVLQDGLRETRHARAYQEAVTTRVRSGREPAGPLAAPALGLGMR